MIKKIEELCAKLYSKFFSYSRVLDYREISVVKTWSDNYVPAHVSESRYCREQRGVKPFLDTADRGDRTVDVWPKSVGDPIDIAVARNDVDWTATLQLNDHSKLPALNKRVALKRQIVYSVEDEPLTRVKI